MSGFPHRHAGDQAALAAEAMPGDTPSEATQTGPGRTSLRRRPGGWPIFASAAVLSHSPASRETTDVSDATKSEDRTTWSHGGGRKMFRLVTAAIAGMALGAAATAGAVGGFRIVQLHPGDVAPIAGLHVFCHVRSESAVSPYTNPSVECGETKHGIAGSFGIGITDDAVYIGRWDRDVKLVTPGSVVYARRHHH